MGHYTVKSAYGVAREVVSGNTADNISNFWNKIWNLQIPLKVKHFVWRAARGCLLTKENLIIKRVEVSSICPVCNIYAESTFHVLVTCPVAAQCWSQIGYRYDVVADLQLDKWLKGVLQQGIKDMSNKVFMVAWSIWKNMNEVI